MQSPDRAGVDPDEEQRATVNQPLDELARRFGVQPGYHDIDGTRRSATEETLCHVLRVLGAPLERPAHATAALAALDAERTVGFAAPVHVAWDGIVPPVAWVDAQSGTDAVRFTLALEDGGTLDRADIGRPAGRDGQPIRLQDLAAAPLPLGRHRLTAETATGVTGCWIVAAPSRVPATGHRRWGVVLPLHAWGDRARGGVADYHDLARACAWIGDMGGDFVATLPLLAAFLDEPFEPSPYVPASRLFWNDLFVDASSAPGGMPDTTPRVPDSGDYVDYRTVAALRRRALERAAQHFFQSGGERDHAFRSWIAAHPRCEDWARFRAACDRWRSPWRQWPTRARDGCLENADVDGAVFRYHLYAAWAADAQLERIARRARSGEAAGLYLDLPIGVHGDGYDPWRERTLFASGVSVGAPPDPFFREGQNWGFAPTLPAASRADGHRHFGECLRHHLQHASVLRIDHAMSLQRLYWIPDGAPATEGVYVEYPQEELLAMLCLEAARAGAIIVGEDLGTVTPEIRAALDRHAIQRMYVAQFEFRPGSRPPLTPVAEAVAASVNTHDLPTFAAFWAGLDLDDQEDLGVLRGEALQRARDERAALRRDVCAALGIDGGDPLAARERVLEAILDILAASPASLLVINPEDLLGETRPQNVPGTTTQRQNWGRRATYDLDALMRDERIVDRLREIARMRAPVAMP